MDSTTNMEVEILLEGDLAPDPPAKKKYNFKKKKCQYGQKKKKSTATREHG